MSTKFHKQLTLTVAGAHLGRVIELLIGRYMARFARGFEWSVIYQARFRTVLTDWNRIHSANHRRSCYNVASKTSRLAKKCSVLLSHLSFFGRDICTSWTLMGKWGNQLFTSGSSDWKIYDSTGVIQGFHVCFCENVCLHECRLKLLIIRN